MSEISLIITDGLPTDTTINNSSTGAPLIVGNVSGNVYVYPFYESFETDDSYNKSFKDDFKLISSNMTFTISGFYTVSGFLIKTSSCIIDMQFNSGISDISIERITFPSGSTISSLQGTTISSLRTLKDDSTSKLTLNITFTIKNARRVSNVLNADLDISYARNYNHLTSTTVTPSVVGYTNYAPGQFLTYLGPPPTTPPTPAWPTTPQVLKGTISGVAGTFNNSNGSPRKITFTSTPGFTHIVHPSLAVS